MISGATMPLKPVTLPPGRLTLAMSPVPIGSYPDRHDNGDRRGRLLGRYGSGVGPRDDDIHLESDQLGGEVRQPFTLSVRETVLTNKVPALDVAKLTETLFERLKEVSDPLTCLDLKNTDPVHPP